MTKQLFSLLLAASAAGCISGARTNVTAPGANVPVSMSRGVRDANGQLVPLDQRQYVGTFEYKTRAWSTFYTLLPFTPNKDISDAVNTQVAAAGGEAVVNLTIISKGCSLNRVWPFIVLPIWPGCSKIEVVGDIITVGGAPTPEATPAAAPAPTPVVNP